MGFQLSHGSIRPDPNVGKTLDIYEGLGDYLRQADFSKEELNGYILNTYAIANQSMEIFKHQNQAIWMDIPGKDKELYLKRLGEIREITLEDRFEVIVDYKK